MKFKDKIQADEFLAVVNSCEGDVILTSIYGDRYNLKSAMTQYLAIAGIMGEHGDELELFCTNRQDEAKFTKFFFENPDVL